jgi:hypothetical protein
MLASSWLFASIAGQPFCAQGVEHFSHLLGFRIKPLLFGGGQSGGRSIPLHRLKATVSGEFVHRLIAVRYK